MSVLRLVLLNNLLQDMGDNMNGVKSALIKWKAGQRMEYPPNGKKYVMPRMLGKVSVK
jgi:hypothetical protein